MSMRHQERRRRTRSYIIINDRVYCFRDPDSLCFVSSFTGPTKPAPFHDSVLLKATREINVILKKTAQEGHGKDLHILATPDGLMLAWAECDGVSAHDDEAAVRKVLALG